MESEYKEDFEYYAADDDYPLIEDREYYAECIKYKFLDYFCKNGKQRKLYLCFQIFMGGDVGIENIWMVFNMPLNGRIGTRSKYYKYWHMAHGGEPSRNARMSPRIFKNKYFKIKTRTVKTYDGGEPRSKSKWYSVVDEILLVTKKSDTNEDTNFEYEYELEISNS